MAFLEKFVRYIIAPLFIIGILGVIAVTTVYFYYSPQIPSVSELRNTQLHLPLRVYSNDNQLIAEFGQYRRRPVSYEQVPDNLRNAFISIEDARFYQHKGVDFSWNCKSSRISAKKSASDSRCKYYHHASRTQLLS